MTKAYLLSQSVKEFEDKQENALFWEVDKIYTKSGYLYLVKKNSRPISCALHFASGFQQDSILGKYETADILINTREELGFEGVITYKGFTIAFTNAGNYNETMGQWHYIGVGAFSPISNRFFITDEKEVNSNLGINSTETILSLQKDYPIVPHFFQAKTEEKYILFEAFEDGTQRVGSMLDFDTTDDKMRLHRIDDIKLTFVNFTRDEAMAEMYRIQQESLKPDTKFGIMSEFKIKNDELYQMAFNWRVLAYSCAFTINYYITQSEKGLLPRIRQIVYNSIARI